MVGRTTASDADNSRTSTEEATSLAAVLTRHSWLIRCWLTNFATDDLFSCLQPATQSALLSLTDEELQRLATDLPVRPEWPDELREMLDAARRVAPPATATRVDDATNLPDKFFFGGLPRTRNMGPKKRRGAAVGATRGARRARGGRAHDRRPRIRPRLPLPFSPSTTASMSLASRRRPAMSPPPTCARGWCARSCTTRASGRHAELPAGMTRQRQWRRCGRHEPLPAARPKRCSGWRRSLCSGRRRSRRVGGGGGRGVLGGRGRGGAACPPLVSHGGGSFCNLAVRLHPTCRLGWLEASLTLAVAQIDAALRDGSIPPPRGGREDVDAAPPLPPHDSTASHHRFVLVGLHACGDLTPTLLRLAASAVGRSAAAAAAAEDDASKDAAAAGDTSCRPRCAGVVSVGCCYHMVSEPIENAERPSLAVTTTPSSSDAVGPSSNKIPPEAYDAYDDDTGEQLSNFPMSSHCKGLGLALGEIALHLSLQAVWRWPVPHTSIAETTSRCRQHLFRCVLEARLQQIRGKPAPSGMRLPRDGNVGSLPPFDSFEQYAPRACERLGVVYDEEEAAKLNAMWEQYKHLERPMRCFVMLRGVLSRLIERLVTIDRLLFMQEAGLRTAYAERSLTPECRRGATRSLRRGRRARGASSANEFHKGQARWAPETSDA